MFFDPLYFLFLAPGILLALWAQARISSTFRRASEIRPQSGYSGAETAHLLLRENGLDTVAVEPTDGFLSDHYDPSNKVLRLSPDVYQGRSLAALGVAAHEAGHAFQDAQNYPLLSMRNALVPVASFGGSISWILIVLGFVLAMSQLLYIGIAAFSMTVLFQLVNLPVEFDASRRAKQQLDALGIVPRGEQEYVAKVLNAAAWTYVAGALTALLTFLYYAWLVFGRRD